MLNAKEVRPYESIDFDDERVHNLNIRVLNVVVYKDFEEMHTNNLKLTISFNDQTQQIYNMTSISVEKIGLNGRSAIRYNFNCKQTASYLISPQISKVIGKFEIHDDNEESSCGVYSASFASVSSKGSFEKNVPLLCRKQKVGEILISVASKVEVL